MLVSDPANERLVILATHQEVIRHEKNDGATNGDYEAVRVQSADSGRPEGVEEPSANQRANDAKSEIQYKASSALVDELVGYESSDQPENNPKQ